jgi:hypothetical protein
MPSDGDAGGELGDELRAIASFKKTSLMVFGLAMQTFGTKLTDEQEVLMHMADIAIDVFSAESAVLRAQAASTAKAPRAALHVDAARVFVNDAAMRIDASARQAFAATVDGDTLRTMLAALRRLLKVTPNRRRRRRSPTPRWNGRLSAILGRMGWMAGSAGWGDRLDEKTASVAGILFCPSCLSCPSHPPVLNHAERLFQQAPDEPRTT